MSGVGDGPLDTASAGLRFLLEVATLIVLGYWGYRTGGSAPARIGLAVGLPVAVAVVWGLIGAPAAPYRLRRPWRTVLEVAVFGGAAAALYGLGRTLGAVAFGTVAVLNTTFLYVRDRSE